MLITMAQEKEVSMDLDEDVQAVPAHTHDGVPGMSRALR